jgi:uncharacterized membrane protein
MKRMLRRLVDDRSGAAAMLTALCLLALFGATGFAVDLGHVYMRSRQLQGAADLAAMAAAQAMAETPNSPAAAAQASAQYTAGLNLWPGAATTAQATLGSYSPDATLAPGARFSPGVGATPPNAVQVTLQAQVPLFFAGLLTGRTSAGVSRTATAAETQLAAFSIGSGLASLNGGVANAVLSALTGSQVSLSVMNYQALASANVSLFDYLPALQSRAGLQAASFNAVLAAQTQPSAQLGALADALSAEGQTAAASAANALAAAAAALPADSLSPVINLGPYGGQDRTQSGSGAMVSIGALNMVNALLDAANGSRQLAFSLDGTVPGLAGLKAWLAIGQRPSASPWLAIGEAGQVTVRTAQMRLYLQATVAPGGLGGLTGGALLTLPVYAEVASASATLDTLQCEGGASAQGFDLTATPSLGTLAIAGVDPSVLGNFTQAETLAPATIVNAPLLKATAFSETTLGGGASGGQDVSFSAADVAAHTMKSVATSNLAAATTASLLGSTTLQVQVGGLGLGVGVGGASELLSSALTPAATALDGAIDQIEAVTGVQLGVAYLWPNGLRCNGAALVA